MLHRKHSQIFACQAFDSIDTKLIEEWKSHRCIKFFREMDRTVVPNTLQPRYIPRNGEKSPPKRIIKEGGTISQVARLEARDLNRGSTAFNYPRPI